MASKQWTVVEAKAHLSEILRRARFEGPQRIGIKSPCILVTESEWQRLSGSTPRLGDWLVENMAGLGEIELPDRADPPRDIPFEEET